VNSDGTSLVWVVGAVIILALLIPFIAGGGHIPMGSSVELQSVFCQITAYGNDTIVCDNSNDTATFVAGDNISLTAFPSNDTIRIDATAGEGSGEVNTASNLGSGEGLFTTKSGVNLPFKSLTTAGDGIVLTGNANDVELSLNAIPKSEISATGTFGWTEISKTGSSIYDLADVTSTPCIEGKILKVNSTGELECADDETGVGGNTYENNTMSSPTMANSLVLAKSGVDLPIKGIACGGDITCSANSTDITLSFTDGAGSVALNDLTDAVITSPAYPSILFYDSSNWIDKVFSINTQSASNDIFITGINNQTGAITTNQFSVNTITCSGTNKIISIDNVTGSVVCGPDVISIAILTAGGATLQATASPVKTTIDGTFMDYITLDFDASSAETAIWNWEIPDDADTSQDITVRVRFQVTTGTSGVCFDGSFLGRTAGETVDASFGTVIGGCDATTGAGTIETVTLTFTSAQHNLSAGDTVFFKLTRDVADATDTETDDARLINVRVSWS
jgi:hypothetical protein